MFSIDKEFCNEKFQTTDVKDTNNILIARMSINNICFAIKNSEILNDQKFYHPAIMTKILINNVAKSLKIQKNTINNEIVSKRKSVYDPLFNMRKVLHSELYKNLNQKLVQKYNLKHE